MNDRLYRSRDERIFAGVAGGVAERFEIDPSLVRIGWVILMFLSGGLFFLLYVVMAFVVPEAPAGADRWAGWGSAAGGPGAASGGRPWAGAEPGATPPQGEAAASAGPEPGTAPPQGGAASGAWAPGTATGPQPWSMPQRPLHRERSGIGTAIAGLVLVVIGGYFLLQTLLPDLALGAYWPAVIVLIGVALLVGSLRPGSGDGPAD